MADSFVYQPHVHEQAGVLTPDLLIDRLFYVRPPDRRWHPLPVSLLSTATTLQQVGGDASASAALVLVTAGNGALATAGSAHGLTGAAFETAALGQQIAAKPIAREAVRLRNLASDPSAWTLRTTRISAGAATVVGETRVGELEGLGEIAARCSGAGPGERWMLFLSAGHLDPDPRRADAYEVELIDAGQGFRIAVAYGVVRLEPAGKPQGS